MPPISPTPPPTPHDFTPEPWHRECYVPSDDGAVMLCPDVHAATPHGAHDTSLIDAFAEMANGTPVHWFTVTDAAMIATVLLVIAMSVTWYLLHVHGARR